MYTLRLALVCLSAACVITSNASAATPKPGKAFIKYKNPAKVTNGFGRSVTQWSNQLIVGAPYEESKGAIYIRVTNKINVVLRDSAGTVGANLGATLDADGITLAAGAPYDRVTTEAVGSVCIFDLLQVSLSKKIVSPEPQESSGFGSAIAMDGDLLVVGASDQDTDVSDRGAVYVYTVSNNVFLGALTPPSSHAELYFGSGVELTPEYILVGAPGEDGGKGAVHVYDRGTRAFIRTIPNPEGMSDSYFGSPLQAIGSNLAAGSFGSAEKIYIVNPADGSLVRTLPNPLPSLYQSLYGFSMDAYNNRLLVGAPQQTNAKGISTGCMYLFDVDSGNLLLTLSGKRDELYGYSVSFLENNILVGTPGTSKGRGGAQAITAP